MKIIILDFNHEEVFVYDYDGTCDAEEKIFQYGHNPSDCEWMVVTNLKINI